MSGPMESGPLGFETSRVRSRMAQGWAPWGWFWDLPGLAPSRMRSGIPQGWALQGQLWDLPGSGPMGTGLGPPWMLGPAGMTGAGPPRFVNSQGQICDLPGPAGTGVGLGSPGTHGESLSWSAQEQGWFQALWGFTQGLALPQVHKLLIVVELLLGEIPDRLQFRQPSLKRSLMPYFLLTQGTATHPCCLCPSCNLRE